MSVSDSPAPANSSPQKEDAATSRRVAPQRTADEIAAWRATVAAEHSSEAVAANRDHLRKLELAAQELGFSGALRRAIHSELLRRRRPPHWLAAEVQIEVPILEQFRAGEATLPSDAIDRLVHVLNLRLMAEVV